MRDLEKVLRLVFRSEADRCVWKWFDYLRYCRFKAIFGFTPLPFGQWQWRDVA